MKKITNNDLADIMGFVVGKEYRPRHFSCSFACVKDENGQIVLDNRKSTVLFMKDLIGADVAEVDPKPYLTQREILILKGRQAEGYDIVYRDPLDSNLYFHTIERERFLIMSQNKLFDFIGNNEEYRITELLKVIE